jgi:small subunit ribosomal protein S2
MAHMQLPTYKEMLDAGVHFGHMKRKWNPKMQPYIFSEHRGIHIIDLNRTAESLERAGNAMRQLARSNRKILFVATKKQAREIIMKAAASVGMPHVTDRWLGGMMTNFATVRRSIRKMEGIDRMLADTNNTNITKKERLTMSRERNKIEKVLGGVTNLNRPPAALFLVDIKHEHIALAEARRLGIKTFAMVDTNSDPNLVDFPIPANDDASKSIELITAYLAEAIKAGMEERDSRKASDKEGARTE